MALATDHGPAKEPVTPLAGPYGHPFHPILVTIPIGAFVMSVVFDLASIWSSEPVVFIKGAYWLIGAGVIAALLAALFGLLDLLAIPRRTRAFAVGLTHMGINLVVVALFAVSFFVRRAELDDAYLSTSGFILSLVALGLLLVSGFLGGTMAYRYGVRVADDVDQAEGFTGRAGSSTRNVRRPAVRQPGAAPT